jgi:hypothetical protein
MAEQASADCEEACRTRLLQVTRGEVLLVLDAGFEIFNEYRSRLSLQGQPGVGDVFFRWVHDHQFNPERCERVALTRDPSRGYAEFPDDPDLAGFDPSDRKFAAAARASAILAPVLNAVDSDWWDYQRVLSRHHIVVEFACSDQVSTWRRHRPQR